MNHIAQVTARIEADRARILELRKSLAEAHWRIACLEDVLEMARLFHKHRDKMNAALHVTPVRWSPLTQVIRDALRHGTP